MDFKEKAKDVGKHIIGRGAEVRFKNEALEYERVNGVSKNEARKAVFLDRMSNVQNEILTGGVLDAKSKGFKEFKGAAREIFGEEKLREFSTDPRYTSRRRGFSPPLASPTGTEVKDAGDHYARKFNGQAPPRAVLWDTADSTKNINELMNRAAVDYSAFSGVSLESALSMGPEMGADIGEILERGEAVERHERKFDKNLKFDKAMEGFKETAKESLVEMFWKAPTDFLNNMWKKRTVDPFKLFSAFLTEGARLVGRETVSGAKVLSGSLYTFGSLIKNKGMR
jgi:hypothetical protein